MGSEAEEALRAVRFVIGAAVSSTLFAPGPKRKAFSWTKMEE